MSLRAEDEERVARVRRLLRASRAIYEGRASLAPAVERATGLTAGGVELGFAALEREATDAELHELVSRAGVAGHVHVVLSANVFVAPLRALALALAAAERVTVRPSPRDPVLARELVALWSGEELTLSSERDVGLVGADAIHVYGGDRAIEAVRERARPGVEVRGHGPGVGVAVVTCAGDLEAAARALAVDVASFDQRGCLSPRVAWVEGDDRRARAFAEALHASLEDWAGRAPRGAMTPGERAEVVRWRATMQFSGQWVDGPDHAVAVAGSSGAGLPMPPAGRHVLVEAARDLDAISARVAPIAPYVVAVGTDDPASAFRCAPAHARLSALGRMQRPPLDGPVDRRPVPYGRSS